MRRIDSAVREHWQDKVEAEGLIWHTDGADTYWDESAAYAFSLAEIEAIEEQTEEVHDLYREAGHRIVADERLLAACGVAPAYFDAVRDAWRAQPPALHYGRFDFGWSGEGPIKLFEFNCDTPTSMLEAAVIQWTWKEECFPAADQFNSLHEKLRDRWAGIADRLPGRRAWFAHIADAAHEDSITATYMRELAQQAGIETHGVLIDQIGIDARGRIVDQSDHLITALFKLYPWEWLAAEEFGTAILPHMAETVWIEPVWKAMWSNKGILAVLWEMFPGHPNLLPAGFDLAQAGSDYVTKPVFSREGANIEVVAGGQVAARSPGDYGGEARIWQERYPMRDFGRGYPVLGSWIVAGEAAGLGIREDGLITGNRSRFVPHIIED